MDPERQPLLGQGSDVRCRRYGPLTAEEVQATRQEITWRRTRFFLVLMFWALIAMFLSIITCILVAAPRCTSHDKGVSLPSVPPVHMTFAPLIFKMKDDKLYTL
ncbi:hypothetical protein PYW07_007684 [Mythimna separata]|uniref:Solute carrier family 3 member 2 N-terminal domain-containing protein n=1 Tax=Mythimna separata TaxID=271217 RepID=A0AAD7YRC9_MYTSE|nr:hypothetical protein PYW07_007684 [Mythimna separata]